MTIALSPAAVRIEAAARSGLLVPTVLAIVAGFVDSCTFLAFDGFFVAQATGSYVLAGAGLWAPASFAVIKVAAIPVFMAAGMATTFAVRAMGSSQRRSLAATLLLEAVLMTVLMVLGAQGATGTTAIWACLFGLAAMGVHGALCRLLISDYGSTNVMTTNTLQFSIDLADSLLARRLEPRLLRTGRIMLGFLAGVVGGALAFSSVGFLCLLAPILALTVMAAGSFAPAAPCLADRRRYGGSGHAL
jgi:uncharacterized membrane protein YoaK (UPF0700 family)